MSSLESLNPSFPTPRSTYHVFLSFRGEDTRKTFTDHLHTALLNAGILTFRDDDEIQRGANIESELARAIRDSRISVVVFSKTYASSRWCLDELKRILDRRRSDGQIVFPVFYDVAVSDVECQTGWFAEAFAKHEERYQAEIEEWKAALREASSLEGFVLQNEANGHESRFIKRIVNEIGQKLNRTVLCVPPYTVGLESRVKDIDAWLHNGSSDVGIGVVCGMGGVGKTTVVKVAYNLNYGLFEGHCFIANVREASGHLSGLVSLQQQLLSNILNGRKEKIYNADEGIIRIKESVSCKRVLIVLDDVDKAAHLSFFIGNRNWFCPGSKIIITTRHEKLLKSYEKHELFKINELDDVESLKLFSWSAFGQDQPSEAYMDHSLRAVHHCGGLPLALQDIGSFLSGRSMDIWTSELDKLDAILHSKTQKNLEISYQSLPDDHDKKLFLLIASSFIGEDKEYVVEVLEKCDFYPTVGIQNLVDRSLVRVDSKNKLAMPHLVHDMAREIIRRERPGYEGPVSSLYSTNSSNVSTKKLGKESVGLIQGEQLLKNDRSIRRVNVSGIKRSRSSKYSEECLPYQGNSLKRRLLGFLSLLPLTTGLKKLFPSHM